MCHGLPPTKSRNNKVPTSLQLDRLNLFYCSEGQNHENATLLTQKIIWNNFINVARNEHYAEPAGASRHGGFS